MGVFRFKQFTIDDSRCAMKTGTDAVLLGSWAPLPEQGTVLDVGSGSGIISLMVAQRNPGLAVTGIEIDREAARQAEENARNASFGQQIRIVCNDISQFAKDTLSRFDLIISNPPYFHASLRSPSKDRNMARHDSTLTLEHLTGVASRLLLPEGALALILPYNQLNHYRFLAASEGLFPSKMLFVRHRPGREPVRWLSVWTRNGNITPVAESLSVKDASGSYSADYLRLTSGFYLFA
jgi:tRNA1Val (adenine37-N6)-methyltransferase